MSNCHLGTPLKKHMANCSSTQQPREFENHNKMEISKGNTKQSRDLQSCAIFALNEFLARKRSPNKIKVKKMGRALSL